MKRKTRSMHIVSILLALFFLVAGTGMNVVKYCCDICSDHGIEEVAINSCGSYHEHETDCCNETESDIHDLNTDIACSDVSHQTDGCHILRLIVEIPVLVNEHHIEIRILEFQVFHTLILNTIGSTSITDMQCKIAYPPPYFMPPSGRDILSLKSVLII
jgi:hypothetical protein